MKKVLKKGNNPLKIGIFVDFFFPEKTGLTYYIYNLYESLRNDIKPVVVTFGTEEKVSIVKGFKVYTIRAKQILGNTYHIPCPISWVRVSKKLISENFDIVNTHTRFFMSSYLGYRFSRKIKVPLVHTEHGSGYVPHNNLIVRLIAFLFDQTLGRLIISNSKVVCTVSKKGTSFVKKLGAKRTEVIYNGINVPKKISISNKKKLVSKFKIDSGKLNVVFVGRIVKEKGVQDLFEAISLMSDMDKKKFDIYVIGDGNYLPKLRLIAKELNLQVNFLGFRDQDFIMSFLQLMDVFVNPSYAEGLPTSVLEAGICGCEVIATDVGGTSEIINNETGYLFESKDILKLCYLLLKADRMNFSSDLINRLKIKFLLNKISKTYLEVLNSK